MPDALWFTDDPEACKLLARDPFALLVGFAIDQQVTVQKAFAGPLVLQERAGTLDPRELAGRDLTEAFATKPAIHRFPGAMATRVRELAAVVRLVFARGIVGMIDASATTRPSIPRTRPRSSTTLPIAQVPAGWK